MPINATAEFKALAAKVAKTKDKEEKLRLLQQLLSLAPTHKGAENLRAELKARIARLKQELERKQKKKIRKVESIEKQGIRVIIFGPTNSGKSMLLNLLTNAKPKIASYAFTTTKPEVGMFVYDNIEFQLVELPALVFDYEHDRQWLSYAYSAEILLIMTTNEQELTKTLHYVLSFCIERSINIGIIGLINSKAEKAITTTVNVNGYDINVIECDISKHSQAVKHFIRDNINVFRIYLKPPTKKQPEEKPLVFTFQPTLLDVLEEIHKKPEQVKQAKVLGSSVKFPWQIVKLEHKLNDNDVVEFHFK